MPDSPVFKEFSVNFNVNEDLQYSGIKHDMLRTQACMSAIVGMSKRLHEPFEQDSSNPVDSENPEDDLAVVVEGRLSKFKKIKH